MNDMPRMTFSPLHIQVILHIYAIAEPLEKSFPMSSVLAEILDFCQHWKIIEKDSVALNGFRILPRGVKWVEMLCETPLPIQQWVDPRDMPFEVSRPLSVTNPFFDSMKAPMNNPTPGDVNL